MQPSRNDRLARGGATITELAESFGTSLTGMKKHVRVLEDATYRRMLEERLDRFGDLLERTKGASQ